MNRYVLLMAGCALWALGPAPALADCRSELAAFETGRVSNTGGISKDGSLAPLQAPATNSAKPGSSATAADGTTRAPTPEGGVAKDGTRAPLDAMSSQAMSGQDAQAQQAGDPTAAETAQTKDQTVEANPDRAIAEAKTALMAGNEEACLAALRKIAKP